MYKKNVFVSIVVIWNDLFRILQRFFFIKFRIRPLLFEANLEIVKKNNGQFKIKNQPTGTGTGITFKIFCTIKAKKERNV